jgi:hypothetical protein
MGKRITLDGNLNESSWLTLKWHQGSRVKPTSTFLAFGFVSFFHTSTFHTSCKAFSHSAHSISSKVVFASGLHMTLNKWKNNQLSSLSLRRINNPLSPVTVDH